MSRVISSTDTVYSLKKSIKAKKDAGFSNVDTAALTIWLVSIPVLTAAKHDVTLLDALDSEAF
ncbi:hypothetical protein BGZ54_001405, partial [Gamsiella multidivaricata]